MKLGARIVVGAAVLCLMVSCAPQIQCPGPGMSLFERGLKAGAVDSSVCIGRKLL